MAHTVNNNNEELVLQTAIDNLHNWSIKWGMAFNVKKWHILHLGKNNPKLTYTKNGTQIPVANTERGVGVLIEDNLEPSQHCRDISRKATAILYQISRAFHFRDRHIFVRLYKQ